MQKIIELIKFSLKLRKRIGKLVRQVVTKDTEIIIIKNLIKPLIFLNLVIS